MLQFGGRDWGEFTRSELIELHAFLDAHLKLGSASATAWLKMSPEDRARVSAVTDGVREYFCSETGNELNGRPRRIAAALTREFVPAASDDGIAAALRIKPAQVAGSRRWLKGAEQDERMARALAMVRKWIQEKLRQPAAPRQVTIRR